MSVLSSGQIATTLSVARLRRLLRLQRPESPIEEAALRDQASVLFYLNLLFATTGVANIVFFVLQFSPMDRPILPAIGAGVAATYALVLAASLRWRQTENAYEFLSKARLLYVALGTGWGGLIGGLALHAEPSQHALVIGLALGVTSTPIICVPAAVAFGFFVPSAFLSIAAVGLLGMADPATLVAFTCFTIYAVVGIVCTNLAFNGRSDAQAALRREIATVSVFLREYQEGSPDWLWETDGEARLRMMPPTLAATLNLPLGGARLLGDILEASPPAPEESSLAYHLRWGLAFRDLVVRTQNGLPERWFALTGHPVYDDTNRLQGFRGIGRDITDRYEADIRLAHMARHDGLTSLLNRKAFVACVERACAEGKPFALISIDLDEFKSKNDTYGHQVGDALLMETARRILATLGENDLAGRLGGDEFVVFLAGADLEAGHAAALRMAAALAEPATLRGVTLLPRASLGVASSEGGVQDASRMFLMVDLALYKAKDGGKGTAARFEPELEEAYLERGFRERELAEAVENGEITVAYQPIADLATGQVLCLEALARWHHPERGAISPAVFIQMAEDMGLIDRLGELILREACHEATHWPGAVQVNVNLSPKQLVSGCFPNLLDRILAESGLAPERLGIEITENIFIDFSQDALRQLRAIGDRGVKIVLDDFGTGYSSLSYLRSIDVDGLKIDASFLQQLPDRKVEAIIRTVTRLTADLNIYLVAEGVERAEQLAWLRANGIHFGQGYLLGRPRPDPAVDRIDLPSA